MTHAHPQDVRLQNAKIVALATRVNRQLFVLESIITAQKSALRIAEIQSDQLSDAIAARGLLKTIVETQTYTLAHVAEVTGTLTERVEKLELEQVGSNRTFRININDIAELAKRVEKLEKMMGSGEWVSPHRPLEYDTTEEEEKHE